MEDSITLRVRDGATELLFKVRRNTPLARVREAYTSKRGAEFSNVQFFIDGRQVSDADTAASLELDDSDVIEVGSGRENKIRQTLIEELEQRIGQSQTSVSQLRVNICHFNCLYFLCAHVACCCAVEGRGASRGGAGLGHLQ
jgi:small ubiquitin-related modifier